MKTGITNLFHHHLGRSAFAALLVPLACAAATGIILNRPPTAENLSIVAAASDTTTVITPIVLKGTDPDGDPLTYRVVSFPSRGTLGGLPPNLIYIPDRDFLGIDGFTYVVNDGRREGTSNPATVSITVKHGLLINNIGITEGNSGPKVATFTVSITGPGTLDSVRCFFHTADGTAKAGSDYFAGSGSGTLSIVPGAASLLFTVAVIGETLVESDETFLVQVSDPSANAVFVSQTSFGLQTTDQPSISGRGTILNDDGSRTQIGTAALAPENSVVGVGEPVNLSLTWTHPVGWRQLDSVDLLLVDDLGEVLPVRWRETENSFGLFNPAADRFIRIAGAGSPARFETSGATLYLQESSGGGPPGHTATIDYSLSFKPQAAGRTFSVEAFATDDAGNQQGFESVGTITVLPR